MGRLRRFAYNRYVGRRDQMVVYDCDDDKQLAQLQASAAELSLDERNLLQAFAPDTAVEARNRGFRISPAAQRRIGQGSRPPNAPDE